MYWCYIIWSGCNPFPGVNASPSAPQCSRHCLCQASPFQCWPRQVSVLLYMPGNATLTFQYASSVNSLTDTEVLIVIFFSLFSFDITHTGGKFALTGNTVSQRQCDNNVTCHRGEGLGSGNVLALSGFPTIDCCYTQATEMLFTLFTKRKPLTLSANWIGCCRQFIDGRKGCNLQFLGCCHWQTKKCTSLPLPGRRDRRAALGLRRWTAAVTGNSVWLSDSLFLGHERTGKCPLNIYWQLPTLTNAMKGDGQSCFDRHFISLRQ